MSDSFTPISEIANFDEYVLATAQLDQRGSVIAGKALTLECESNMLTTLIPARSCLTTLQQCSNQPLAVQPRKSEFMPPFLLRKISRFTLY